MKRSKSHLRNLRAISKRVREVQAQRSNWNQPILNRNRRLFWQLAMLEPDHVIMDTTKIEEHGIAERIELISTHLRLMHMGMLKAGK